ncbi:Serine protease snake [Amphibalanus amphitrite]|uniref:Serine protease snake n=1 Tax=Amphibalanus amphitrite TaxID=1232801 RepID=A0A6A4V4F4_AMPAM|nr:Serine protease snake [Amphibalanus amphitrite]
MLFSVLTVTVLAALMTVPGQVEAQRGRTQECLTPTGFLGSCRYGLCVIAECVTPSGFLGSCRYGRCPSDGGPSPVCARGYSCCVQVTRSRPRGTNRRQGLGPTSFGRKTLLNPQFECGGEPAPEPMPDPSAIVFPRTKRQAPKPGAPTPAPGSGALFVAGGAPEPSTNAVGVLLQPKKPAESVLQTKTTEQSETSPSRRRYKRSPQTAEEAQAFESVWQEYQERVRAGDAPAGYTRQEILEAFRAASAEAALNPDPAPGTSGWTCGAVLISERFMLTAAHCLLGGRPQVVRLGDLNLTSTGDGAPQEYRVLEVISHPEYRHPHVYHDLALLRLDRTVQFSEFVRPFCLFDGRSSLVDKVSHVSGWGATEFGGGQSDVLMGGNVTIWSQSRCAEVYERQLTFKRQLPDGITPALLCAGGEEQDACQGDSGGPMTVLTERGTRLVGIVSAGIGCAAPGIPGLYANVAHHLDWIDGVVYGGQGA